MFIIQNKEIVLISALRNQSQGIFFVPKIDFLWKEEKQMANTNIKGIWLPIDILINSELNDKEKIIYTENDYEREIERINNKHEREVGKLNKYIDIKLKCWSIDKADMGFEFQSRYITLRIRLRGNPLVVRGVVQRLFHLSKSQR